MQTDPRCLLVLDLDETLIYAAEQALDREPDFLVGPYFAYMRPGLEEFLQTVGERFRLAVWTSSSSDYAATVVRRVFLDPAGLAFAWSRERCIRRIDAERCDEVWIKDLRKIKRLGYDLARVLVIDDSYEKLQRNYGNLVLVNPFFGDPNDNELGRLGRFLSDLQGAHDVRPIEKRGWRTKYS